MVFAFRVLGASLWIVAFVDILTLDDFSVFQHRPEAVLANTVVATEGIVTERELGTVKLACLALVVVLATTTG